MTSAKYFDAFSLVVTRGHSWSTRGHSWSLVCTFRHDHEKMLGKTYFVAELNGEKLHHRYKSSWLQSVFFLKAVLKEKFKVML